MHALAAYIMRGRVQAVVVALICSWLPFISPAVVALVTLRRGGGDGAQVLLWASLPAVITLAVHDLGLLMALLTLYGLVLSYMAGVVLRASVSWSYTLLGMVATSTLFSLSLMVVASDQLGHLISVVRQVFEEMQRQAQGETQNIPALMITVSPASFSGFLAYVMGLSTVASLLLARWWQSLLYNPGGFQEEFHRLRLRPYQAVVCLGATVYCLVLSVEYQFWSSLFALPLLLVGLAIVHRAAAIKNWGTQWLVLLYLLLLVTPIGIILSLMAVLDAWMDFRARIEPKT